MRNSASFISVSRCVFLALLSMGVASCSVSDSKWTERGSVALEPSAASHEVPNTSAAALAQKTGFKKIDAGQFEDAAKDFQTAADAYGAAGDRRSEINNLINRASALNKSGNPTAAISSLDDALLLDSAKNDPTQTIAILATRGQTLAALGRYADAASTLTQAEKMAASLGDPHIHGQVFNDIGNADWARADFKAANDDYSRGFQLVSADSDSELTAELGVNATMSAAKVGDLKQAAATGMASSGALSLLPATDAMPLWIEMGDAFDEAYRGAKATKPDATSGAPTSEAFLKQSYQAYSRAVELAVETGDTRAQASIYGRLSRLYSAAGRVDDALKLSRRAVAISQEAGLPDACAQWEFQTGRLLWAKGPEYQHESLESYWNAVDSLQRVVGATGSKNSAFWKENRDICLEAMDRASRLSRDELGDTAQADRLRILKTAEQMKSALLCEYFQDECVAAYEPELSPIAAATKGTAVVYVIPFYDRTEVFVAVDGVLTQSTAAVGRQQLDQEAIAFRMALETRTTRRFLHQAITLYDWLFRPIEKVLAAGHVDTLVFLSDGPLMSVPIAPLYDGNHFLIEKYAVAVTPAMRLTDFEPVKNRATRVLAAALAEAKPGLPRLAFVDDELAAIRSAFGVDTLENQDFTIDRMTDQIQSNPYRIVHIASHGVFGYNADQTYIATGTLSTTPATQPVELASADRAGMPNCCVSVEGQLKPADLARLLEIARFRDQPVELLVLSACDTAAAKPGAIYDPALGLAGIGVKSGARSTLATLWSINDEATSRFMAHFYQGLRQDPPLSKAQAVRAAQLALLNDPDDRRFRHPCYWSAFILAGNWK